MSKVSDIGERLFLVFHGENHKLTAGKGHKKRAEILQAVAEERLQRLYQAAQTEREQHRLGAFSRARIAFYLQKRLLEAGYAPELVRQILFSMLLAAFVNR